MSLSCVEEQDFDQFDDLSVTPTLASGLLYVESTEDFINSTGVVGSFYTQTFSFDAFSEQYVAERLLEGTITYQIENTTSKRIAFTIEFLDEGGNVLDVEAFDIDPAPSGVLIREVAYGPAGKNLVILTTTSNLRVSGNNLSDTTSTSSEPEPKIIVKSAAEFLFQLK
ncbi:MAG: hypothetical protein R2819_14550 [Allomuricauda sp.]